MTTYRYKNTTKQDLVLVGVGVVKAGKVIEVAEPIENPNLAAVTTGKKSSATRKPRKSAEVLTTKIQKEVGDVV